MCIRDRFIIYADFESSLINDEKYHQKHEPLSVGLLLITPDKTHKYHAFTGVNCVVQFLNKINQIVQEIVAPWYVSHNLEMNCGPDDEFDFYTSTNCYLCGIESDYLVRDHDHFTGKYLGAACNQCNLSRRVRRNLPIVFS